MSLTFIVRSSVIVRRLLDFVRDLIAFAGAKQIILLLGLMVLGGVVEGLSLALLVPLLALLTGTGGGLLPTVADRFFTALGANSEIERLGVIIAAFIAAMIIRGTVLLVRDRANAALQARYVEHRRLGLLEAVASADWQDVMALQHARVTSALTGEIGRIAAASQAAMQTATSTIMLAAQLVLIFFIAPAIGLFALIVMAAAAALSLGRLRVAAGFGEKVRHGGITLAHTAGQLLGGLKQAAAENRQATFVKAYADAGGRLVDAQIEYQRRVTRFHFAVSVGIAAVGGLILVGGAWTGVEGAALIAALLILSRMAGPALGLQMNLEMLSTMMPAHEMIDSLRDELCNHATGKVEAGSAPQGPVVFAGVNFKHPDSGRGVRDLDLSIEPGEVIGIVGASGAGKTTFVDLMIGLLQPDSGTIRVGETVLDRDLAARWRERVAYVGQDVFLIDDTIRANLLSGVAGSHPEDALWSALALAGIDKVVRAMPAGLDTQLGERAIRLSGGERQRVALARAVLRRPALLILDEATNAIDIATEAQVLGDLIASDRDMTVIVIAHRNETLRLCSRILTFDQGRLVPSAASAA